MTPNEISGMKNEINSNEIANKHVHTQYMYIHICVCIYTYICFTYIFVYIHTIENTKVLSHKHTYLCLHMWGCLCKYMNVFNLVER